jgi:hypothetical protein
MWILLQNKSVLGSTQFTEIQTVFIQGMTGACPPKSLWYLSVYKEHVYNAHAVGRSLCYGSKTCNLQHKNKILTIKPHHSKINSICLIQKTPSSPDKLCLISGLRNVSKLEGKNVVRLSNDYHKIGYFYWLFVVLRHLKWHSTSTSVL